MLSSHSSRQSRHPPNPAASSPSAARTKPSKRYHPYVADRRCRFSEDSVSPSPPPSWTDSHNPHRAGSRVKVTQIDYLSALPQELIEEIGLLACTLPFLGKPPEPFLSDRHRLRTLYALTLVSKQFNQIFCRPLYSAPLLIDTQNASSLRMRNTASMWRSPSRFEKAQMVKRFTLWRPCSEEMKKGDLLCSADTFFQLFMLSNVRELTLSGNFRNTSSQQTDWPWMEATLMPKYVPHLTSVRLLDIDDAELLNVLLIGVAHKLTSLVIQPSCTGLTDNYSPRSVYSTLRPMIENLTCLESLDVTLPTLKLIINHCNHAHKLVQKTLVSLPKKEKLKSLSMTLPLFDCRSMQWTDGSDSDDDHDAKTVDHAWFWMTLQNLLAECDNLERFTFTGSPVPLEIVRKLQSSCPTAAMSFIKADKPFEEVAPPAPQIPQIDPHTIVESSSQLDEMPFAARSYGPLGQLRPVGGYSTDQPEIPVPTYFDLHPPAASNFRSSIAPWHSTTDSYPPPLEHPQHEASHQGPYYGLVWEDLQQQSPMSSNFTQPDPPNMISPIRPTFPNYFDAPLVEDQRFWRNSTEVSQIQAESSSVGASGTNTTEWMNEMFDPQETFYMDYFLGNE